MKLQTASILLPGDQAPITTVAFLLRHQPSGPPTGPLRYLHYVRSPTAKGVYTPEELEKLFGLDYTRALRGYVHRYKQWAAAELPDLIVSPPSTREDAVPYRQGIQEGAPHVLDVSGHLSRSEGVSAGRKNTTLEEVVGSITRHDMPSLSSYKKVAIVDDVLVTGKSAAAVLHHLYEAGLEQSAKIFVCAPLWIDVPPQTQQEPKTT